MFIISDLWYELSCCWGFCKNGLNWWIVLKWYLISCLMCFWKPFWVHEPVNNLCKHIWVLGDQIGDLGWKRGRTRKLLCRTANCTLKRAPKCAPRVQPLVATGPCTLKRICGRLSVQARFQHLLIFVPGTNRSFVKHFFQLV